MNDWCLLWWLEMNCVIMLRLHFRPLMWKPHSIPFRRLRHLDRNNGNWCAQVRRSNGEVEMIQWSHFPTALSPSRFWTQSADNVTQIALSVSFISFIQWDETSSWRKNHHCMQCSESIWSMTAESNSNFLDFTGSLSLPLQSRCILSLHTELPHTILFTSLVEFSWIMKLVTVMVGIWDPRWGIWFNSIGCSSVKSQAMIMTANRFVIFARSCWYHCLPCDLHKLLWLFHMESFLMSMAMNQNSNALSR
jgi:hypothetical protein